MSQKHGVQTPNHKIIRIFLSRDSILFLTKEVIKIGEAEFWYSDSDEHEEILSLQVSCKTSSNILLSCCYKPPMDDNDILSRFLKQVFKKSTVEKKPYWRSQYKLLRIFWKWECEKLSTFCNSLFECGAIALINKPTGVAR